MEKNTEKIELTGRAAAALVRNASVTEGMHLHGTYHIQHWKPKEGMREQFIAARDGALKMKDRAKWLQRLGLGVIAREVIAIADRRHQSALESLCYVADEDSIINLVTTAGKNDALDKYLAGSAYTAAFYMGLVDGATAPTYAAADTMSSHAGWTENQNYTQTTRQAPSWSAASGAAKSTSTPVSFSINTNGQTLAGAFITTSNTKGGTTGTLYSCGNFTGGNKTAGNGDTIQVSYTANA
ncbi:MAG: hypothetical protein AB1513_11395 [Pseudomonadota bacterium]